MKKVKRFLTGAFASAHRNSFSGELILKFQKKQLIFVVSCVILKKHGMFIIVWRLNK